MDIGKLKVVGQSLDPPFKLSGDVMRQRDQLATDIELHNAACDRLQSEVDELLDGGTADYGQSQQKAAELKSRKIELASAAIGLWDRANAFRKGPLTEERRRARDEAIEGRSQAALAAKAALSEIFDCSDRDIARWVEQQAVPRHPGVVATRRAYEAANGWGMTFNRAELSPRDQLAAFVEDARKRTLAI